MPLTAPQRPTPSTTTTIRHAIFLDSAGKPNAFVRESPHTPSDNETQCHNGSKCMVKNEMRAHVEQPQCGMEQAGMVQALDGRRVRAGTPGNRAAAGENATLQ